MRLLAWRYGVKIAITMSPKVTQLNFAALSRESARSAPEKLALRCGDIAMTYRELAARSNRLANGLVKEGIRSGDRIAWLGQNCHRWIETLIAAAQIGAILCPMNWRLSEPEQAEVLSDLTAKVVIWQFEELGDLAQSLRAAAPDARWICHDSSGEDGYEQFLAQHAANEPSHLPDGNEALLMISVANPGGGYSGSLLSHANLIVPAFVMAQLQAIDNQSTNLVAAPLYHIAALFSLVPTLLMRGTNVMVRRADAAAICRAIDRFRCTHGFLLGPTAEAIVRENHDGRYDLKSFRSSLNTAGWQKMVTVDLSPWGRRSGGYGQTETNMAVLAALAENASSVSGVAAPYCEVRIVGADDQELDNGETGEIVVRGPNVHLGYWNRDLMNKARFRNDWWHTGDLGRRSPDGTLTFIGPMGRMIKSGAENVYSAEVERCLLLHPAVGEVAVIGIPDDLWGQSIKALVVVKANMAVTNDELLQHCRTHLAAYKKPRSLVFLKEALPRTGGGAIDYARIDAQHGGEYPGHGK
jgi:acyl-CoA synthetase (AMP-forming)/AMP-acid ligase II